MCSSLAKTQRLIEPLSDRTVTPAIRQAVFRDFFEALIGKVLLENNLFVWEFP